MTCKRLSFALALSAVLTLTSAYAQDNWNGGTGNWSNGSDWNAGEPGPGSDVVIYSGGNDTVTLDVGSTTISSLTLGGPSNGTTSELTDAGTKQTLTITNALNVGQTGTLYLYGGSTVTAGADSTSAGEILLYNGSTLSVTGNLANSGTLLLNNGNTLQINGDVSNSGLLNTGFIIGLGGNTLTITGTLNNRVGGELRVFGPGDMANLGSLNQFWICGRGEWQYADDQRQYEQLRWPRH
jgi:hypothetical protein